MRTVPLGTSEKLFRSLHRKMLDSGYEAPPWDRLDSAPFAPDAIESARRAWGARVEAEYRSMVVFSELLARFPEVGLPLEVSCATTRLIQDEARHTELCARVADALGGHGDVSLDPGTLRLVRDDLSAKLFVARWTVSMFCVGESSSVGLLRELAAGATDPCVKVVVDTLLRDETLHDRFGWALARLVIPLLNADEMDWLGADLAFAFAHYDQTNGACLRGDDGVMPPEADAPVGANLGVIPRPRFAKAFYERIDNVILPGLAELGVPAYEAWALRHEARRG